MKKKLQAKTRRERLLIRILVVSLVFGVYMLLRVKPLNDELGNMESRLEEQTQELEDLNREIGQIRPSQEVKKDIEEWQAKLESERRQLEGLNISFVDLNDSGALYDMLADITNIARQYNLQIISKQDESRELASMVGAKVTEVNKQLKRHMFNLKMRGTFESVYMFIQSLSELEFSVLITRLSFQAEENNTYNGQRLVLVDLTLAI